MRRTPRLDTHTHHGGSAADDTPTTPDSKAAGGRGTRRVGMMHRFVTDRRPSPIPTGECSGFAQGVLR
jgi:hypothetical protein